VAFSLAVERSAACFAAIAPAGGPSETTGGQLGGLGGAVFEAPLRHGGPGPSPALREKCMKKLLFGFAALPFLAGVALAAEPLSDVQMDRVTAGDFLSDTLATVCRACTIPTNPNGITLPNAGGLTNGKLDVLVASVVAQLIALGYSPGP
jgi:hypothetical protein